MSKLKQARKFAKKATALATVFGMAASLIPAVPMQAKAADFTGPLTEVKSVEVDRTNKNIVMVTFNNNVKGKITFLEDGIFRYNVDPSGQFSKYATPNSPSHVARIQQYPDESDNYTHPDATVTSDNNSFTVTSGDVSIVFDKASAKMTVKEKNNVVMEEEQALNLSPSGTVQTVKKQDGENFYGGGMQNGRFVHTGEKLFIGVTNTWVDGCVTSPTPFYYTTNGYGVLRNTFKSGDYDFGKGIPGTVTTTHGENEFDAYYFVTEPTNGREITQELLKDFYKVTGNPALLPEYGFYLGHLNAYNRDGWSDTSGGKEWNFKGTASYDSPGYSRYETGMDTNWKLSDGMHSESLNGEGPTVGLDQYPNVDTPYEYSARAVIDEYQDYDMPLGFFLPNDGYGAGYGQNGYWMTGGVDANGNSSKERLEAVKKNVENLQRFAAYAAEKGVETGLWTQSYLEPDSNSATRWHTLRDFRQEVAAGVTTLKTDVAWVGSGYSMQLDGVKTAYDIAAEVSKVRPNIISLDGWAGSQRFNGIWSGDQSGGNWEYIRFHIPTYIGSSLSGNPNVGSDMDGIHGGSALISARDYQWKTFTQFMLNMDGWGAYAKMPYTFGDPYTGISRMYLKIKSQLMPYLYTTAYSASNIEFGEDGNGIDEAGLPMIRAMFLEYPDEPYAYGKNMQYQYMYGRDFLVAPVYQNTKADAMGNDIRNNIFLPDSDAIWVDFFTGKQYKGGQNLSNYDAPLWKLPVFVKNGAIVPQYEPNNSPANINKANRIVEFWPAGNTNYTAVEDDGKTIQNDTTNDDDYGVIDNVSYGGHVTTKYTSNVEGTKAVLKAEKSDGSYEGYKKDKNTTFIVHVSKKPSGIIAKNGSSVLQAQEVTSKDAFDKASAAAGKAVWFYDETPQIESFASDEEVKFKQMLENVEVAPKLYVKFATVDAKAAEQTLEIEGFENKGEFPVDQKNEDLAVPELTEEEDAKTATSITINWTKVDDADSYELLIDGVLNSVGNIQSYTHTDLAYASSHTYQVRSRNEQGYSDWSEVKTFTSDDNPWKDTPVPKKVTWPGGIYGQSTADKAFDQVFQSGDSGFHSNGETNDTKGVGIPLTVEYEKAYKLDKIEYYPRTDGGNGTVSKMKLESSLDGVHWKEEGTYTWQSSAAVKTMNVNTAARFLRFTALASVGNFFAASEIKVYAVANSKGFAVGSTLFNEEVMDSDYNNLTQYKGLSNKDVTFDQVQAGYGDININGYYDVYDYAYTLFQLDGGTKKTGSVGGTSTVTASKEQVAEGEEFTLAFQVSGAGNVNALGQVIPYDPSKVEFVSVEGASAISQMQDLTVNKVCDDGTAYVDIAFANRGDKALYSGSDTLVTLKMRAKKTISTSDENVITPYGLVLIGPDYSTNGEIASDPITVIRQYTQDDFDIKKTNAELTEDDGTNVTRLIQQKKYDGLFNGAYGTSDNRDFEFLWDVEDNHVPGTEKLPAYVTLPLTMNLKLKTPGTVGKLIVHNANKGNGFVTSVKAKVNYEDETSEEKTITLESNANFATFTFEDIFTPVKNVESVDLTFLKAIDSSDAEVTNMLTLSEIEVFEAEPVDPEDPPIGPNDPDPENPLAPGKKYAQNDFNLTITNDEMPTDEDGNNVQTLINQKSFDGLFDGAIGRDFELLWNIQDNWVDGKLPSYIKVPFTIHLGFKESAPVSQIAVYNANRANGYVTAISAKVNYADGTSTKERIRKLEGDDHTQYPNNHAFVLKYAEDKDVASIDITVLRAIVGDTGEITKNMTTLAEIEVSGVFSNQELLDKIEEYSNVTNPDELYITATWEKFQTELEKLNGLTNSEDQAAVDKAVADAEKAYKALKTNRSDLESEYNKRKDLSNEDGRFTKESFEKFQAELKKAEELLGNEASTGTACKAAKEALAAAFQALVQLDRSALLEKISEYEVLTNEDGAYTASSWDAFQKAIKDARGVLESLDATQAQIDAAVPALTAAFEALVLNRTVVETEVKKFEAIQNTDNSYTADSWNVFQAALKRAQDTLADPNATPAAINEAFAGLQTAFQALKKADSGIVQPPAPDPAKELKKGDKVVSGGVQYKVLNASKKTAVAAKIDSKSKNAKSITIKATVTIKGVSCKVTEISTGAFKNAKNLSSVTIGKNVKTIGKNAFNGCTKLSKVTFKGTSVPAIKTGAFKKTKSGMTVKVPKKMTKAKRRQLSKKMASTGAKKLKLK